MEFITDKLDKEFTIPAGSGEIIYSELNFCEKNEIDNFMKEQKDPKNCSMEYAISILYGVWSQRRRMNPRLIEGVRKAIKDKKIKKNKFSITLIPNETLYIGLIKDENDLEVLKCYNSGDKLGEEAESISLWVNQISIGEEYSSTSLVSVDKLFSNIPPVKTTTLQNIKKWLNSRRRKRFKRNNPFVVEKENRFRELKEKRENNGRYRY